MNTDDYPVGGMVEPYDIDRELKMIDEYGDKENNQEKGSCETQGNQA